MRGPLGRHTEGCLRFKIHRDLAPEHLILQLPARYRDRASLLLLRAPRYHLVLFGAPKDGVILSGVVRKALGEVPEEAAELVAAAPGFTAEGLGLLQSRGAVILTLGDHPWTDASLQSVRQATRLPREGT
jgi:hypothetical protein